MGKKKELVVVGTDDYAIVKMDKPIAQIIQNNLGGEQVTARDFPKIPIPGSGGTTWSIETIDGEQEMKEVQGVIVYSVLTRVYWETSFDESGGGSPPDCVSVDGITGEFDAYKDWEGERPTGRCVDCPFSKFGSHRKGRAQACQQRRLIFIIRPDNALPYYISIPPTSINPAKKFLLQLAGAGLETYERIVNLSLTPDKNADGIKYSKVNFGIAAPVPNPDFWKKVAGDLRPILQATAEKVTRDADQDEE